jgi:hypothetical protein
MACVSLQSITLIPDFSADCGGAKTHAVRLYQKVAGGSGCSVEAIFAAGVGNRTKKGPVLRRGKNEAKH